MITTGTPVENHLDELWTLFNFLNPGLLGTFKRFKETFALPIERDQDKDASRRLRKLIRPFILRRLKSDVLTELPQKTEITLQVEMSPEEALDGSTPAKERQVRIKAFQNGEGDLFLISLKAGGFGLNLTAADYVIHMDPWWNPAVEDQASDRAHRMGQTRPVTVYRLVVKGSIEEQIVKIHKEKRDLAEGLLAGSEMAGKMSASALLELLKSGSENPINQ